MLQASVYRPMWTAAAIARAATEACRLEASAPKPGNVTPRNAFPEMTHADFLASARAIGPVLGSAGRRRVGETILLAVEATRRVASANTNLGTILLLAPLARAAASPAPDPHRSAGADPVRAEPPASPEDGRLQDPAGTERLRTALRARLHDVLRELDVADAELAYRAIRLAAPGGMGRAPKEDLSGPPTVTLLDAMRLAADRDAIAREYATDFETTFTRGLSLLARGREAELSAEDAVVELFLELLGTAPDTLIERKFGRSAAEEVSARAARALASGTPGSSARARAIEELDGWLRDAGRRWNPGSTADLVAAVLFVDLLTSGLEQFGEAG